MAVELAWRSFAGSTSVTRYDSGEGGRHVGVAPCKCDDCGDHGIVLACAGEEGVAVSVQLDLAAASALAHMILAHVEHSSGGRG